jgi:hypothetical protein
MDEEVAGKVNGPGIALMVVGALSLLGNVANLIWQGITAVPALIAGAGNGAEFWLPFITGQGISLVQALVGFITAFLIIYGGSCLRQTKSAGMVYVGSVLAIVPCCSGCCCIFGLPVGIWVIMTMQDDQVKDAFAELSY